MNVDLDGKIALFHGADGIISAALQQAFAANGATIERIASPDASGMLPGIEPFVLINVSAGADGMPEADREPGAELQSFAGLTRMLAPRLARVVNVFSAAGLVPVKGFAQFSAGQAGLASLTRALAMELGPDLRVNGVAVGAFDDGRSAIAAGNLVSHTALRRPATLGEIAAAALFLADPDNAYMTGHTLNIDGGWAAGYARNF